MLQQKKGYPRFVSHSEALADRTLVVSLDGSLDTVSLALDACVRRGTLTMAIIEQRGEEERLYALNTSRDRRALAGVASDGFVVGRSQAGPTPEPWDATIERPNIFALYESNIGMLNPMIADDLKEAEALYPMDWIEDRIPRGNSSQCSQLALHRAHPRKLGTRRQKPRSRRWKIWQTFYKG